MKYLIIDDEYIAHEIIKGYCELLPNMELMKSCYDAIEAMEYLKQNSVDFIFLDLNMPKLKGFDFLKTLSSPPKVIVTTAYKEFAIEGYELNVVDYLLKPFSFERFLKAINKLSSETKNTEETPTENKEKSKQIFFKSSKKYYQIEIDDILYFEAAGNYTKIFYLDQNILIREKISETYHLINSTDFVQVHKSFFVNKHHIESIEGNRIFIKKHIVPIGKLFKSNVQEMIS
ncbi:LytR/AlgR family response regulator transcription factor [Aureivirga sp. CE67]|uniref:LytR/AlgR family response regulator transcription factor n=1 Tax=Aureivirga sp. CE67 TaxID=1788983 RepID=UPI0018C93580|nr:LytTR family DNA-binding domain-containing protein [Aureivirga sp. CE67]